MSANARRFEQVYRIHAWITVGFLVLLVCRSVLGAIFVDRGDAAWIALLMWSVIIALLLWLHLHAILGRSKKSRCGVVLVDGLLGGLSLYSVVWTVNKMGWNFAIKTAWFSMLFSAGMGIWFLSSAIMTGVYLYCGLPRQGGKSTEDR